MPRTPSAIACVSALTLLNACSEPPAAPGDYARMSVDELREAWVELHAPHTTHDAAREAH